jgi:hypothetical protein
MAVIKRDHQPALAAEQRKCLGLREVTFNTASVADSVPFRLSRSLAVSPAVRTRPETEVFLFDAMLQESVQLRRR